MENFVIHKAATRGAADHGWLKSHHSFSFANYYNPDRMNFGVLRVLNDDTVDGGRGFGDHPHDNMEIISIPLEGDLVHKDSMGNEAVINRGEIQAMSAGTGIYHSEYNKNGTAPVKFLQIWLYPNKRNVKPRYDQVKIDLTEKNVFHQILSPNAEDAGVWIHQNAWFNMGKFDKGAETTYQLNDKTNGVYAFILSGSVTINGQLLDARDGMGILADSLNVKAETDAEILLMEVPMEL
ncbi:pirin family protein [Mucilaginibacter agri]|uniref:Pirin family protein n=1 Tax=Mucilaginibacter agri TaxID=2695265 RepID=A0A966DSU4_9SPHI|nr:pirin family protein [Mucilaginibacter agri]NCD69970.1 pirin family protein [Mucilaginibacter agri]